MREDGANVGIPMPFQASSLHAFIVVGLRDPDIANQPNFAPAAEQRFPRGLLQPERGMYGDAIAVAGRDVSTPRI